MFHAEVVEEDVESYLRRVGQVFAAFRGHDSNNTSLGVEVGGERWFVKFSSDASAVALLEGAVRGVYAHVQHEAIVPLVSSFRSVAGSGGELAVVHPWRDGHECRDHDERLSLPVDELARTVDVIVDAHVACAAVGFVAVDFYDSAVMWNPIGGPVWLFDLDCYSPP